jgi:hypothetical protein
MATGGGLLGLLQLGENPPAVVQVALAGFGQVHAARGARQQQGADAFFEGRHRAGHAGGRQVQTAGGSGKTLFLGDGEKHLHFLKPVHSRLSCWAGHCIMGNSAGVLTVVIQSFCW